jgi:hypothetical protein
VPAAPFRSYHVLEPIEPLESELLDDETSNEPEDLSELDEEDHRFASSSAA